jgi:hypothetical protein
LEIELLLVLIITAGSCAIAILIRRCLKEEEKEFVTSPINLMMRERSKKKEPIIFLDGTCCVGKTSAASKSFDFVEYVKKRSLYKLKNDLPYVQSLYEARLMCDLMEWITRLNNNDVVLVDRCNLSQFIYSLFFYLEGPTTEPGEFVKKLDLELSSRPELCAEIRLVFQKWILLLDRISGGRDIFVRWLIPTDLNAVVARLKARGGFENRLWPSHLDRYVANQNTTFQKICRVTGVGRAIEIDGVYKKR